MNLKKRSTILENEIAKGFNIEIDTLSNEINRQFVNACSNGDIEYIKLLTDNHPEEINIHYQNDQPFYMACRLGKEDVIKYLLFSPTLKENVIISEEFNNIASAFLQLCTNHLNIIESLIMEHNFSKTPSIEKILNSSSHENMDVIRNMFKTKEIIDEKNNLEKNLDKKEESKTRKPKM